MLPKGLVILSAVGTTFGLGVLAKDYFGGSRYAEEQNVLGKTIIITGSNTGIGKETARDLARRGGRVILACRDMDKCAAARDEIVADTFNRSVICRQLDLSSSESVRKFAKQIIEEEKHVDVLINNAGVMCCPKQYTSDGFEWQLGVNYLGPFLLTNLLLDKLKESSQGRIINVISPIYKKSSVNFDDLNSTEHYDPKLAYGQSKLALVLFSLELAKRLEGTNITVNCVNPGVVKTDIGRHLPMSKSAVSGSIVSPLVWFFLKTPVQGAQGPIFLAVDKNLENITGKCFKDVGKEEHFVKSALDQDAARRMWLISAKWTKLDTI